MMDPPFITDISHWGESNDLIQQPVSFASTVPTLLPVSSADACPMVWSLVGKYLLDGFSACYQCRGLTHAWWPNLTASKFFPDGSPASFATCWSQILTWVRWPYPTACEISMAVPPLTTGAECWQEPDGLIRQFVRSSLQFSCLLPSTNASPITSSDSEWVSLTVPPIATGIDCWQEPDLIWQGVSLYDGPPSCYRFRVLTGAPWPNLTVGEIHYDGFPAYYRFRLLTRSHGLIQQFVSLSVADAPSITGLKCRRWPDCLLWQWVSFSVTVPLLNISFDSWQEPLTWSDSLWVPPWRFSCSLQISSVDEARWPDATVCKIYSPW